MTVINLINLPSRCSVSVFRRICKWKMLPRNDFCLFLFMQNLLLIHQQLVVVLVARIRLLWILEVLIQLRIRRHRSPYWIFLDRHVNSWQSQSYLFYLTPHCFHCWVQILIFSLLCLQYCSHSNYKLYFMLQCKSINSSTYNSHNSRAILESYGKHIWKYKSHLHWVCFTFSQAITG